MRWLGVVLLLLVVAPARAAEGSSPASDSKASPPDAQAAALQAATALDSHCADVAAATATRSARAISSVIPALTAVSEAHDATGDAFLLFWRGRLNLCLDREDRAKEDLEAFVARVGDDPTYINQVQRSRQLLRVIERYREGGPAIRTPGLAAAGGALIGVAGAFGGLSGWQWTVVQARRADFEDGGEAWTDAVVLQEEGQAALRAQRVLLGSAVASGVAGLTSFVLSTVAPPRRGARVAALVPMGPNGWGVSLVGGF